MRNLFILSLLFSSFSLFAQNKWHSKDQLKLEDADIYLEITDYRTALNLYIELYKKHDGDKHLEYKIGICNYNLGEIAMARDFFQKSLESGNLNASFYLGLLYHKQEEFEMAISQFDLCKTMTENKDFLKEEIDRAIACSEYAKKMMGNPVEAMVYNLGNVVNSEYDDYGPLIKSDESMMAFTSRREGSTGNKKDPYGEYLEDIYLAYRVGNEWTKIKNIGPPLNTETHDAAVGLSADGVSMIIYRTNEDLSAGDLYLSNHQSENWTEPVKLSESINSEYQEASASLTNDQRTIYFSSNRPGGLGGKDIYRIVRITNEIWSLPLNLGPNINTAYDDDAPFIHPNGETLYFSSKGHQSMGGYDIFRSSLKEDYWSVPQNIGYPANTVNDDIFFVLTGDGKRGYYSSEREDGYGGHDVYAVSFEDNFESLRVVKGKITNENNESLSASIEVSYENGEKLGTYTSNSITGNYIVILPSDQEFIFTISADSHQENSEKIKFQGGTIIKEKIKNFTLAQSIEQ